MWNEIGMPAVPQGMGNTSKNKQARKYGGWSVNLWGAHTFSQPAKQDALRLEQKIIPMIFQDCQMASIKKQEVWYQGDIRTMIGNMMFIPKFLLKIKYEMHNS